MGAVFFCGKVLFFLSLEDFSPVQHSTTVGLLDFKNLGLQ